MAVLQNPHLCAPLLFRLGRSVDAVIILPHPNYSGLIWRIRLRRVRRLEYRECVGPNEQQPEHEGDDCWFICFHAQPYRLPCGVATARVMDFTLPREKECSLPLLVEAQSAVVRSKLVAPMTYLERGVPHTSPEGHENLANAK